MKRIFKKNQIVIAALAVMIAVAGYLNYSGERAKVQQEKAKERYESTMPIVKKYLEKTVRPRKRTVHLQARNFWIFLTKIHLRRTEKCPMRKRKVHREKRFLPAELQAA